MTSLQQLTAAIDAAFHSGNNQHGLVLLRQLNQSPAASPGSLNRQAVIEEEIGDWALAGRAHHRCIEMAPQVAASYLYAGFWLQHSTTLTDHIDAAAAAYSIAQDIDPNALLVSSEARATNPRTVRASTANSLLRGFLSKHHRQLHPEAELARIRDAIWVRTHDHAVHFNEPQFKPDLFAITQIPLQPWYTSSAFAWSAGLLANTDKIRQELQDALQQPVAKSGLRPYLPSHFSVPDEMQNLVGSSDWSALDLFQHGQANATLSDLFPATLAALAETPTYGLDDTPYEVFFSLLSPGQSIAPHYGQSNHSLTVHLPLIIPDDCCLKVAGEARTWRDDELLIFDDSYLHSAHNNSTQQRIVLIFSIWNPALSNAERAAVQLSFKARQDWMLARREKLRLLL